jgi:hypothetical protein
MDGPSIPSNGYTLPGVAPSDIRPPASRNADAAANPPDPTAPPTKAAPPPPPSTPAFVVEFSQNLAGGYVLDCRDPKTNAVLVQVPMRSVFTQMAGAATPEHVGKLVDTTV